MTTQSEYSRAYELGQAARRNGKPRESNAYRHRNGAELLVERWQEGWDDQDARNRGIQHGDD